MIILLIDKYNSWFTIDNGIYHDDTLNCVVCLEFNYNGNHLICKKCLAIQCKQCVDKYYSKHREIFKCPVCRTSMNNQ